jgi:hypothetical protein
MVPPRVLNILSEELRMLQFPVLDYSPEGGKRKSETQNPPRANFQFELGIPLVRFAQPGKSCYSLPRRIRVGK